MSLSGVCYECPICKSQGKKSLVRPLQISINDALIGCEDPECWYPFGIDTTSLLVKSSYKALDPNKACQVLPTTSLACDNFEDGHGFSTNTRSDSILDEFQLDALLQDCSVQLDDDFCQDFNSFLNCENQESSQTDVTSVTTSQEQNVVSVDSVRSDNAPSLLNNLNWDQGNNEEPSPPYTVSVIENVVAIQNNVNPIENPTNEISPGCLGIVQLDNTHIDRDISERFINNVPKHENGSGASKLSKPLVGKKNVSPQLKSGLGDAMKYINADAWDSDLMDKPKRKPKQANSGKKRIITKPNLDFFLC